MSQFRRIGGRYGLHSGSGRFKNAEVDEDLWVRGGLIAPVVPGDIWYVDGNRDVSGNGRSWSTAFKTIQEAHTAATTVQGDLILIAPIVGEAIVVAAGENYETRGYAENVLITKEGLTIMGTGGGRKKAEIRPDEASTKRPMAGEVEGVTIEGCGMLILARSTTVMNLSFAGTTDAAWDSTTADVCGIYLGDGNRIDASYSYDSEDSRIINCSFKMGTYGIYSDGGGGRSEIAGCSFYRQSDAAIKITPGGIMGVRGLWIHDCYIQAPTTYGIELWSHGTVKEITIGPNNVIEDGASAMTNPVIVGAVCGQVTLIGNYFATDNEFTTNSDTMSCGNYGGQLSSTDVVTEG